MYEEESGKFVNKIVEGIKLLFFGVKGYCDKYVIGDEVEDVSNCRGNDVYWCKCL